MISSFFLSPRPLFEDYRPIFIKHHHAGRKKATPRHHLELQIIAGHRCGYFLHLVTTTERPIDSNSTPKMMASDTGVGIS